MNTRSIANALNASLSKLFSWRIRTAYLNKMNQLRKRHAELFKYTNIPQRTEYTDYWSRFGWQIKPLWYDYYSNLSGIRSLDYVPNDVYYSVLERCLNDPNETFNWANKNLLEKYYGAEHCPETFLRYHSKTLYDQDFNIVGPMQAKLILDGIQSDVVCKLAEESCGGHGVRFFANRGGRFIDNDNVELDLAGLMSAGDSFLLQKAIAQSRFTASFNSSSVNTFRVVVLRRPASGEWVVLRRILRMGVGDAQVDNQSSGGISVGLFDDGRLNHQAFDGDGHSYNQHPTSGVQFSDAVFEDCHSLDKFTLELAVGVPSLRLLSFDIVQCQAGGFKCLEVNTYGMQIDFLQTFDGGMFGDYTEEVVNYCLENQNLHSYRHVRGFYY